MVGEDKFILLVDDDEDDRVFFQEAIEDLDNPIALEVAEHGMDALQQLENKNSMKPQAIFLDLNMPVLDGHECLKLIRSNPAFDAVKIIIYSTSYNPEFAKVLERDGANHYIRKPSNYLSLKNIINTALTIINDKAENQSFLINT